MTNIKIPAERRPSSYVDGFHVYTEAHVSQTLVNTNINQGFTM